MTAIYDPNALPFWEIARGDGPVTKMERTRQKSRLKRALQDTSHEVTLARADANHRGLQELVEEEASLTAALEKLG